MLKRLFIGVLLCMTAISATSSALTQELDYGTHQIQVSLGPNEDQAYVVVMDAGDKLTVDLSVLEGGPVDFYLTNRTAYEVYRASVSGDVDFASFYYMQDYSRTGAGQMSYGYTALADNELVVLVDNTGSIGGPSSGDVLVEGQIDVQKNVWTLQNILATALLITLIAVFMLSFKYPKSKGQ